MTRTTLAVAADYADAMLVARRWKNLLFLLLLLFLFIQIGLFLFVHLYHGSAIVFRAHSVAVGSSARDYSSGFIWLVNFTSFLSMICVIVLGAVLLLIVGIMLVGRLIGVSHVTSAFVWCVLLGALLFPWQSLWNYPLADLQQPTVPAVANLQAGPIGLPGVLYTWPELQHRAHFANNPWQEAVLGWARFVGWPVVAVLILFFVQIRGSRGLKLALGEAELKGPEPTISAGGTI